LCAGKLIRVLGHRTHVEASTAARAVVEGAFDIAFDVGKQGVGISFHKTDVTDEQEMLAHDARSSSS